MSLPPSRHTLYYLLLELVETLRVSIWVRGRQGVGGGGLALGVGVEHLLLPEGMMTGHLSQTPRQVDPHFPDHDRHKFGVFVCFEFEFAWRCLSF